jgi:hypothetical protein
MSHERLRTLEFPLGEEQQGAAPTPPVPAAKPPRLQVPPPAGAIELPGSAEPHASTARTPARAIALAGLLAASLFALWLLPRQSEPLRGALPSPSDEPITTAAPDETMPPAATAAPPEPTSISVELLGLPGNAQVTVDGKPAAGNPLVLPRNDGNRVIRVLAEGKAPWQVVHHSSADASYQVFLADAPAAAHKQPSRAKAPPAKRRKPAPPQKPPSVLRKLDF